MIFDLSSPGTSNYYVVGGTAEPVSPPDNTIWINTDIPITGHVFQDDYPTNPYEGLVFIKTHGVEKDSFSVYKPCPIMVYPMFASIYSNGDWQVVSARRYHDGNVTSWWSGDLFDSGVTGTWRVGEYKNGALMSNGAVSFDNDSKLITSTSTSRYDYLFAGKTIELKGFKSISVTLSRSSGSGGINFTLGVYRSRTDSTDDRIATTTASISPATTAGGTSGATATLNVSSIDEACYIGLRCTPVSATASFKIVSATLT